MGRPLWKEITKPWAVTQVPLPNTRNNVRVAPGLTCWIKSRIAVAAASPRAASRASTSKKPCFCRPNAASLQVASGQVEFIAQSRMLETSILSTPDR